MRIGFDIDGVIANFPPAYEALFERVTGTKNFPPADPKGPLSWNWPTDHHGYTAEDTRVVWNLIKSSPDFWKLLPTYSDFQRFKEWYVANKEKHEIYFVTDRVGIMVKDQTERWLERNLGEKVTVLISGRKGHIAHGLRLDMYVDDKAENIVDVNEISPLTKSYLIDRRYNQHIQVENRIERLADFLKAVDSAATGR